MRLKEPCRAVHNVSGSLGLWLEVFSFVGAEVIDFSTKTSDAAFGSRDLDP